MAVDERAVTFECEGNTLVGIVHAPSAPASLGVLIVVGGPQYRAGSHRQFTLLARHLAEEGVPVLRFDYRGMGDSGGAARTFESVDADIRCAIDQFFRSAPGLTGVVIWGLCDAASAALFYAHQDRRVSGLVLANPWVRTEQGAARAYLRHYYVKRVLDPELWRKIGRGEFALRGALAGLFALIGGAFGRGPRTADHGAAPTESGRGNENSLPLPDRMAQGLRRFHGPVLLLLSGNDLTAQEFKDLVENSRGWRRLIGSERVSRYDLPEANHTFARREWRDQVARWTAAWVKRR